MIVLVVDKSYQKEGKVEGVRGGAVEVQLIKRNWKHNAVGVYILNQQGGDM